jgi:gluconokinase
MVHSVYPYFKLLHFKQEKVIPYNARITDQGTYMFYCLTGEYMTTPSLLSGMGYLDIHTQTYNPRLKTELGLTVEDQLASLAPSGFTASLTDEAATILGVQSGIPVIPCFPDGGLNQVGSDATKAGVMTISLGTSGAMRLALEKPYLPSDNSTWCYLSPKGYLAGAATSGCCNCVDWAKNSLFGENTRYADIESQMALSKAVPTFLPFLYGERCPGWNDERSAAFLNLQPTHSPVDQYLAVLEGVIFNLFQCYESMQASNIPIHTMKLSGGVLNSPVWKQMVADILAVPLIEDGVQQTSLVGGAKLAMEALNISEVASSIFPNKDTTLLPNPLLHEHYMQQYQQYKHWYSQC